MRQPYHLLPTSSAHNLFAAILASASFASGGCAAVPLAAAGTLAGLAATSVDTGAGLYSLGKLDTAELATFDDLFAATRAAGAEMGFALSGRSTRPGGWAQLEYVDDRGARTTVTVQRRTATLTRCRIDVGVFGSETTARLFLRRLRAHLPDNIIEHGESKPRRGRTVSEEREGQSPASTGEEKADDPLN